MLLMMSALFDPQFADVLKNVQGTQERFTSHFNSFQQSLLQRHGSLSASQAEEAQAKYRLIARCMHHLAHVWHMCSDIHINYTHQQDQTIQVFEPLSRRLAYHPPATAEIVMTAGSINLGAGGLLSTTSSASNTSGANVATTNTSSRGSGRPNAWERHNEMRERQMRSTAPPNASSLPNNFATPSINVQTESPISSGNNSQTATTNSNGRRESPWFMSSNQTTAPQQSNTANNSERTASSASSQASEAQPSLFQNMFGASLPNLANSAANGQPSSNASVISLTTLQPTTVIVSTSRNVGGSQPQTSNDDNQQSEINSLRDLFNFGTRPSTGHQTGGQRANVDRESSAPGTGNQNNSSTNQNNQQSSTFFRMPPTTRINQRPRQTVGNPIGSGFPYSNISNFDPHLPCTSTWVVPEIRFVLPLCLPLADRSHVSIDNFFIFSSTTGADSRSIFKYPPTWLLTRSDRTNRVATRQLVRRPPTLEGRPAVQRPAQPVSRAQVQMPKQPNCSTIFRSSFRNTSKETNC